MATPTIGGMQFSQLRVPSELSPFSPPSTGPNGLDGVGSLEGGGQTESTQAINGFKKVLETEFDAVNADIQNADTKVQEFVRGEESSIHEVMTAMSKADVSFRMLTTVGRKVVEAYQEVMRMQV